MLLSKQCYNSRDKQALAGTESGVADLSFSRTTRKCAETANGKVLQLVR